MKTRQPRPFSNFLQHTTPRQNPQHHNTAEWGGDKEVKPMLYDAKAHENLLCLLSEVGDALKKYATLEAARLQERQDNPLKLTIDGQEICQSGKSLVTDSNAKS